MEVMELLRKLADSGIRLNRADLRELKLQFSSFSLQKICAINEQVTTGSAQTKRDEPDVLETLKRKIRAGKGKMKDFLPYLAFELASFLGTNELPRSATSSLVSMHDFVSDKISPPEFLKLSERAFSRYRDNFNVAYELTSG